MLNPSAIIKAFVFGGIFNLIITDIIFMAETKTSIFRVFSGHGFVVIAYIFVMYGMLFAVQEAIFQMIPK